MKDITTDCPICEEEITITGREIKLASQHRKETGGKVLVSCPKCCRVVALPDPIPDGEAELEEWATDIKDCCCVPILNEEDVRLPNGIIDNQGKKAWRPGGGGPALMKRLYMFRYGINPETMWAKMQGGEVQKPFKIGGRK
jgi:hypothetical protein